MYLTFGKIRLCFFTVAKLPKLQRQLERLIKVRGEKKTTFLLIADYKTFGVSLGAIFTDSEGGIKLSAHDSKQIDIT